MLHLLLLWKGLYYVSPSSDSHSTQSCGQDPILAYTHWKRVATLAVGGGASSEKLGTICALASLGGKDNNGKEGGWDGGWDDSLTEVLSHLLALFNATFGKVSFADLERKSI